jgi:hypothetical protein
MLDVGEKHGGVRGTTVLTYVMPDWRLAPQ